MTSDGSVTHWIREIQVGNRTVAQDLWERYFAKLVQLARVELYGAKRQAADEEDVALSVFDSFCRAAEKGRFPDLADRDSLWRLLVRMTARKSVDLRRHETRLRRGGPTKTGGSSRSYGSTVTPRYERRPSGTTPTSAPLRPGTDADAARGYYHESIE